MSEYLKPRPLADLPLFAERIEGVRESNASKHRTDIERGKPVAIAFANAHGKVTAEHFRWEANRRGVTFDSGPDDQRGFCWIPVMFAELCREGKLQKRRRSDGSTVTEYSKEQHNDQCVYEPYRANQETAA